MPVAPKESTYVSGPDDSLRVVDVYSAGEVLSAFEAASEASSVASKAETANDKNQTAAAKAAAVQNLKSAMSSGDSDVSAEQLLALGLSDTQLNGFIPSAAPAGTDKKVLLQDNPNVGVNELSLILALLRAFLDSEAFAKLTQGGLQDAINSLLGTVSAFEKGSIGGQLDSSRRINETNSRLVNLQTLSREKQDSDLFTGVRDISNSTSLSDRNVESFLQDVNSSGYSDAEKNHIKKTAADNAANNGESGTTAAIAEDMGAALSPEERRRLLLKVMQNYRKPDNTLYGDLPSLGKLLWDDLRTIDASALIRSREFSPLHIVEIYRKASESTLDVLAHNTESKWVASVVTKLAPEPKQSKVAVKETLATIY